MKDDFEGMFIAISGGFERFELSWRDLDDLALRFGEG